jgi:hypothetical protein
MKTQIFIAMVGAASSACVLDLSVGKSPIDDPMPEDSTGGLSSTSVPGESTSEPDDVTGAPPDSTGAPGDSTGAPDDSTGGPPSGGSCPEGQPHLAPLWATDVPLDEFFRIWTPFGSLSDGRLVMSAYDDFGGQILWYGSDGQPIGGTIALGPEQIVEHNFSVQVDSDDSVVAIGSDGFDRTFVSRTQPDGPPPAHVELDSHLIASVSELRLVGDDLVALGVAQPDFSPGLVRADIASGATVWERSLPIGEVESTLFLELAVGPGQDIVAAYGEFGSMAEYKAWRIDGATGDTLWEVQPPMPDDEQGWLADVIITPDDVVLLVGQHNRPDAHVDVSAFALADGAPLWTEVIAVDDAQGSPMVEQALLLGPDVVLPVGRVVNYFNTYQPGPVSASLLRLSSSGQVLEDTPLALPGLMAGTPGFNVAHGPCDGLVLFHAREVDPWLFSYAP